MAKKLDFKWQLIICCILATIFVVSFFILWLAKILSLTAFLILLLIVLLLLACAVSFIVFIKKEQVRKTELKQKLELEERERKLKEIYEILGINIQYNEDGSVKDIFELLNLKPIYDKDGVRILTPYELLKINPIFNEDGKELPNVFIIKNRVNRVTKGIAAAPSFTFKPKAKVLQKDETKKQVETKKPDKSSSKKGTIQTYIKTQGSGKAPSGGKFNGKVDKTKVNDMSSKILSLPKKNEKKKHDLPKLNTKKDDKIKPASENNAFINESSVTILVTRYKPVNNPKTKERLGGLRNIKFRVSIEENLFDQKNVVEQEKFSFYSELEKGM